MLLYMLPRVGRFQMPRENSATFADANSTGYWAKILMASIIIVNAKYMKLHEILSDKSDTFLKFLFAANTREALPPPEAAILRAAWNIDRVSTLPARHRLILN